MGTSVAMGGKGGLVKGDIWTCMAIIVNDYLRGNDCQYLFTWQCFANYDLRGNDCQRKEEADEGQVDCKPRSVRQLQGASLRMRSAPANVMIG